MKRISKFNTSFNPERVVNVYWNVPKKCWSVRQGGRVVGHAHYISLRDVTWRVQASGRERVRREGKKNVHAYASGRVTDLVVFDGSEMPVRYNPKKLETFMAGDTPLFTSRFATFDVEEEKKKKKKKKKTGTRKPDTPELKPRTWTCGINLKGA
jgi:hypothetical protein